MPVTLLNVDVDDVERAAKTELLREAGYTVLEAQSGTEAIRLAESERPAVAILTSRVSNYDGRELCRQLKERGSSLVLLVAPTADRNADSFIPAPAPAQVLLGQVGLLVRLAQSQRDQDRLARERELPDARQAALLEIARVVLENRVTCVELGRLIFERVEPLLDADVGLNYRLDPEGRQLNLVASRGVPDSELGAALRLELGQSFCGLAAEIRTPVVADRGRIATDPLGAFVRRLGATAYACEPLLSADGHVLGTVSFGSTRRDRFEPDDLDFLQTLAHLIAIIWGRAEADQALRATEAALQSFYDNSPYMMGVVELIGDEMVSIHGNEAIARVFGVSPGQMRNRSTIELGQPDHVRRLWLEQYRRAQLEGTPIRFEYERATERGTRWFAATAAFLGFGANGRPRFSYITEDITDRKRADVELQRNESRFRVLFESSPVSIWEKDFSAVRDYFDQLRGEGVRDFPGYFEAHPRAVVECATRVRIVELNQTSMTMFRAVAKEQLTTNLPRFFLDDSWNVFARLLGALADGETKFTAELPVAIVDGSRRIMDLHLAVVPGSEQTLERVLVSFIDVTERVDSEQASRESEGRFRTLADSTPVLIWVDGLEGPEFINRAYREFVGADRDADPKNYVWSDFVHPDDRPLYHDDYRACMQARRQFDGQLRLRRADGTYRWMLSTVLPRVDRAKHPVGCIGSMIDISEMKEAERALRRVNESLSMAQLASGSGIWDWDIVTGRYYVSPEYRILYGLAPDAEVSYERWLTTLVDSDDRARIERIGHALFRAGTDYNVEFRILHPTKGERWLVAVGRLERDNQGRPIRFSGVTLDITERRAAEEAWRWSEERLRIALIAARLGTWEWIGENDQMVLDDTAAEFYGVSPGEPLSWTWLLGNRVHPEDREQTAARLRAAAKGDGWVQIEYRTVHPDGAVLWLRASGQMLFETTQVGRQVVRVIGTTEDITQIRDVEQAVRDSEARFRLLVESLPLLIWTAYPDGRCDYLSPQWVEYTGLAEEAQLGWAWLEQVHPDDRDRLAAAWQAAVEQKVPLETELRIRRADGAYGWFYSRAAPIVDQQNRIGRWFGVNLDIDARKRAEEALRDADRRKDEFLAMLAHELRNPLAPIRNSVALIRQFGPGDPRVAQARDVIDRQVFHLTRLVDDLLDVSRVTQGKIILIKSPLSLVTAIERAVETTRPLIESRKHRLTVELGPDPLMVEGDLTRLVQSIANLLNNAAKYTAEGGAISLKAEACDGQAVVRIRDTGIGIAPEFLPHIFELFSQGDRTLDRSQGGLGIGLTLVKALIELHGGRIEVLSQGRERGTEFVIRLPLVSVAESVPEPTRPKRAEVPPATGFKILIVDDNQDGAESMAALLELRGHDVRTAGDGPGAIRLASLFRPNVVVLDIGLPGMDGYEVAEHLRANPETASVLLIALTGYGRDQDRSRTRAVGFDHHLVKPVDPGTLQSLIVEYQANEPKAV